MPCRALDAFGRAAERSARGTDRTLRLNALSGIGCIRTSYAPGAGKGCRQSLNALSGIGCIRTEARARALAVAVGKVLMPCRALDAFGDVLQQEEPPANPGLNALSGIGCIRTRLDEREWAYKNIGLNALSGIGCIRTHRSGE